VSSATNLRALGKRQVPRHDACRIGRVDRSVPLHRTTRSPNCSNKTSVAAGCGDARARLTTRPRTRPGYLGARAPVTSMGTTKARNLRALVRRALRLASERRLNTAVAEWETTPWEDNWKPGKSPFAKISDGREETCSPAGAEATYLYVGAFL
jgi:hypothetical protein